MTAGCPDCGAEKVHAQGCEFNILYTRAKKAWAANDQDAVVALLMESSKRRAEKRTRQINE